MSKSLKVLVLAQYFSPDMGGASTRASNVVKGLLSKGCNVTVVAAFPHYPHGNVSRKYKGKAVVPEMFGQAKVFRVWIPTLPHSSPLKRVLLHFCFCISSLFALPFVGKVDVVWGANPNLFSIFPSFIYGAAKRVPIVRNVDDLWPEVFYELGYVKSKFAKKLLNFLAWISYAVPAAITPISEGYKRNIVTNYGISPQKIHVIKVGVESVKTFDSCKNLKTKFTVMYSGVLGLGYNFDVVLDGATSLRKNNDIIFIVRGVGEQAIMLKKEIKERALENVVLDTRFLPKNELANLLASANVFVLPMATFNFVELGLPTKVFEYQSYGKPIICVSNGDAANYVAGTQSGLVVKQNDVNGFVDAILTLCFNKELANEFGKNGRKFVSDYLTSQKIGEKMCNVFFSVVFSDQLAV